MPEALPIAKYPPTQQRNQNSQKIQIPGQIAQIGTAPIIPSSTQRKSSATRSSQNTNDNVRAKSENSAMARYRRKKLATCNLDNATAAAQSILPWGYGQCRR